MNKENLCNIANSVITSFYISKNKDKRGGSGRNQGRKPFKDKNKKRQPFCCLVFPYTLENIKFLSKKHKKSQGQIIDGLVKKQKDIEDKFNLFIKE